MILDDNATTSSSFTVDNGRLKVELSTPVQAPPQRPRGRMRRRHSVDFKPAAEPEQVKEVERVDDEARSMCWYSKDEYDIIKARNSLIVKMMKTGHFRESDDHSFRGLEHKLKQGFKQRRANKFNALNAVLEEQDRQMSMGVAEPEKIARKYRRVSLNAAETAFVVGQRDAEESLVAKQQAAAAASQQQRPVQTVVHSAPAPSEDCSEMTPSSQFDDSTIASEESEQQSEVVRLEVRGLFAAASMMKRGSGRMGRRSSM